MASLLVCLLFIILPVSLLGVYVISSSEKSPPNLPYLDKLPWSVYTDYVISDRFKELVSIYGEIPTKIVFNEYLSECKKAGISMDSLMDNYTTSIFRYRKFLIDLVLSDIEDELKRKL